MMCILIDYFENLGFFVFKIVCCLIDGFGKSSIIFIQNLMVQCMLLNCFGKSGIISNILCCVLNCFHKSNVVLFAFNILWYAVNVLNCFHKCSIICIQHFMVCFRLLW